MESASRKKLELGLLALVSVIVYYFAIRYRLGHALPDDAAFFLRYAENMTHGAFWVWNLHEAPVWGASAPLFPLLLVIPLKLGVPPTLAIIACCTVLSTASLTAISLLIANRFSLGAGIAFTVLAALDTGMMYFSGLGLETPLTFALLAFALYVLLYDKGELALGVAAGLLAIHKLDLLPVGGLLVFAYIVTKRRLPLKAIAIAALITVAWYGFAWVWFGAPVPNSFITKALHQNDAPKSISWTWFGSSLLYNYYHWAFVVLALFGAWRCRKGAWAFLIFAIASIGVHLLAYSIKYPFEPYDWYYMPTLLLIVMLASIGVLQIGDAVAVIKPGTRWLAPVTMALVLVAVVTHLLPFEHADTKARKNWLNTVEFDRAQAGRWVNDHTPQSFRVATEWGNPAFFSHRYVYDWSFLNQHYESGDLIDKYRPEIIIMQSSLASTPAHLDVLNPSYVPVKVFDSGFTSGEGNIFFTVYARKDDLKQMSDVVFPVKGSCEAEAVCDQYQPLPVTKFEPSNKDAESALTPATSCALDTIDARPAAGGVHLSSENPVSFSGWAVMDRPSRLPDSVFVLVQGEGPQTTFLAGARPRLLRADVASALKLPTSMDKSGFTLKADLSAIPNGQYFVSILTLQGADKQICGHVPLTVQR